MKIKKDGKVITLTESDLQRIVKKILKEDKTNIQEITSTAEGGWLILGTDGKIVDGKKKTTGKRAGCLKFVYYEKEDGKWVREDEWAQGLQDTKGYENPLNAALQLGFLDKKLLPDQFEKIKFDSDELATIYKKWGSGSYHQKVVYAKNKVPTKDEKNADIKIEIYVGGDKINSFCRKQWG
jgi:hypothetical protein